MLTLFIRKKNNKKTDQAKRRCCFACHVAPPKSVTCNKAHGKNSSTPIMCVLISREEGTTLTMYRPNAARAPARRNTITMHGTALFVDGKRGVSVKRQDSTWEWVNVMPRKKKLVRDKPNI